MNSATPTVEQVGGSHYAAVYQHWDLVNDLQIGYQEANCSKYLTRSHKKNGLEDLKKSLSYVNKLILQVENKLTREPGSKISRLLRYISNTFGDRHCELPLDPKDYAQKIEYFFGVNDTPIEVRTAFTRVITWQFKADLVEVAGMIQELIDNHPANLPGA